MAKTGSFIKLDRGLKNNSLWLEKPFSKGQAWVDLLILSQGVDKEKIYKGKMQQLKHGNVYTSLYYLSNRWGWSRSKVYRFLEELMFSGMIEIQGWTTNDTNNDTINRNKNKTKNGTVLTIANWAFYQYEETNNDTNNDTNIRKTNSKKTILTIERQRKKKKDKENDNSSSAPLPPFPCGVREKPEWMSDEKWEECKCKTMDDIPSIDRGLYDTYIEYVEAECRGDQA